MECQRFIFLDKYYILSAYCQCMFLYTGVYLHTLHIAGWRNALYIMDIALSYFMKSYATEVHIRRGKQLFSPTISLLLSSQTLWYCQIYSKELSQWDDSLQYTHHRVILSNKTFRTFRNPTPYLEPWYDIKHDMCVPLITKRIVSCFNRLTCVTFFKSFAVHNKF